MGPTVLVSPSPRRRAAARLTALALTALVLGACSGAGVDDGDTGRAGAAAPASSPATSPASTPPSSAPSASPSASRSGASSPSHPAGIPAPDGPSAVPSAPPSPRTPTHWAGSKQFVLLENVWGKDGRTYLSARSARKEPLTGPYEGWDIIPGKGPYTTVRLAPDCRILLSVPLGDDSIPHTYSQSQFISRWWAQSASVRTWVGFDLSFDADGEVVRIQSLYRS
ncbi:hypothetical protein [Actinacidiphila sp. bgisy167]|uniref:hypothetical protein n=1 Tax=Actinacidiphila sp. bgisy167 TaxID=3413797 RepID=UPI003D75F2A1